MLLCCGRDGLLEHRNSWQIVSCPLPVPSLAAQQGPHRAILDNTEHLLWLDDQLFSVDCGVECLLMWRGHPLILSGDTDSLTLLDAAAGDPLFLSPAGIFPQDMCLLPGDAVAVCGGGSGRILIFRLPELQLLQQIPVPGSAQRITRMGRWLYVLCAAEDDGLQTLLCRVDPQSCRYESLCTMPGLPGALYADTRSLWSAASEALYRFLPGETRPALTLHGCGLIRHITGNGKALLLSDPMLGTLFLKAPGLPLTPLIEGDVGQALIL